MHGLISLYDAGAIAEIKDYCETKGILYLELKELTFQHRCGGSEAYIKWVDDLLDGKSPTTQIDITYYHIEVFDTFDEFYSIMAALNNGEPIHVAHKLYSDENLSDTRGTRARMVASTCWRWQSENDFEGKRDFPSKMKQFRWNKKRKNYVWASEPDFFNQIGCFHTCQGLEFEYIGVIISPDLACENGIIVPKCENRATGDHTLNPARDKIRTKDNPKSVIIESKRKQAEQIATPHTLIYSAFP